MSYNMLFFAECKYLQKKIYQNIVRQNVELSDIISYMNSIWIQRFANIWTCNNHFINSSEADVLSILIQIAMKTYPPNILW